MNTTDLVEGTTLSAGTMQFLSGEDGAEGALSSEDPEPKIGRGNILGGRYEVQGELGRGGGSRVFRAYDRATKTAVAVKVMTGKSAAGSEWLERLGRELRLGRQGRHPNVCEVFDIMEAEGCRFLTMALATGGTLRDTLVSVPERSWPERIADARAVVSGLAALHADGIEHRDLKPENILRMGDGRLVLSDLGLAVSRSLTTFTGSNCGGAGTPPYMAPEVALGGEASTASDVFSFGVVLHEDPVRSPTRVGGPRREAVRRCSSDSAGFTCARGAVSVVSCLSRTNTRSSTGECCGSESAIRARGDGALRIFKGAMKAGKWGIVAGLVLAVAASGTVSWMSGRSTEMQKATLVGEPVDWSRHASLVTRRNGPIHCISPSVVHAFDPRRLATTDLSGSVSLLPEVSISDATVSDPVPGASPGLLHRHRLWSNPGSGRPADAGHRTDHRLPVRVPALPLTGMIRRTGADLFFLRQTPGATDFVREPTK